MNVFIRVESFKYILIINLNYFKKDTLGLMTLDQTGRLHKLATDGDHLQFGEEWFLENIVSKFIQD